MQAVLLAAGLGSRLGSLTRDVPKALIPVGGKPLLAHALSFASRLAPSRIVVVGGFCFPQVKEALVSFGAGLPVELAQNQSFRDGNLVSLLTARPLLSEGFLVMNVDHIYRPAIAKVVAPDVERVTAFIDTDRKLGDDDMKVERSADGRVAAIAKGGQGLLFTPRYAKRGGRPGISAFTRPHRSRSAFARPWRSAGRRA